jgi:plasmid stability protein
MAQLVVRNIENEVKTKLQRRAKRHGRSMEEEVREILRDATKSETEGGKGLGTEIAALFRDVGLKPGEEIQELHDIHLQVPDFVDEE